MASRHHPYSQTAGADRVGKQIFEDTRPPENPENKLYVGNLDSKMSEYNLLQLFKPFGKIAREEFMWHTGGPKKGTPRGYAFVEMSTRGEAEIAMAELNGKTVSGRTLVVRFSNENDFAKPARLPRQAAAAADAASSPSASSSSTPPNPLITKPSPASVNAGASNRPSSSSASSSAAPRTTADKIAEVRLKLKEMQAQKDALKASIASGSQNPS